MPKRKLGQVATNSPVPSLARLCCEQLVNSKPDLRSLDEHSKTLLLKHLLDERPSLLNDRHDLERLKGQIARIPAADEFIYFGDHKRIAPRSRAGENEDIDVNKDNGYEVNNYFRTRWEYWSEEAHPFIADYGPLSCRFDVLYRDGQSGEFRLCEYVTHGSNNAWGCTAIHCYEFDDRLLLEDLTSSSTLLTRLVAAFGLPTWDGDEVDGYKGTWGVTLRNIGGGTGFLRVYDYKGGAAARFYGNRETCKSAVKLVTWLVGNNVPLPYDGVLAGRVA